MNEITKVDFELAPLAPETQAPLLAVIAKAASDPRVDIEKFERLLAMQEKLELAQERRDFNAALAAAKGEISPVAKNREVDFTTAKGRTNYRYEDFAAVARAVDGPLSKHGISYRFRSAQTSEGDSRRVRVTCILSRGGYSEETTLECFEDHSGNKNPVQAIMSAATYLQRGTLKLALGLAASNDDDGNAAGRADAPPDNGTIGMEKALELVALAKSIHGDDVNLSRFYKYYKIESMPELPAKRLAEATADLKRKD